MVAHTLLAGSLATAGMSGQDKNESRAKRQKILLHFAAPVLPPPAEEASASDVDGALGDEDQDEWLGALKEEKKAADAELRRMRKTAKSKTTEAVAVGAEAASSSAGSLFVFLWSAAWARGRLGKKCPPPNHEWNAVRPTPGVRM